MDGFQTTEQLLEQRQALIADAKAIVAKEDATAEDWQKADKMLDDAEAMLEKSKTLQRIETLAAQTKNADMGTQDPRTATMGFKSFGEYLYAIWRTKKFGDWDKRLRKSYAQIPDDPEPSFHMKNHGWIESAKDLTEGTGASGGFLVFPEYRADIFQMTGFQQHVRERALVLPMQARQTVFPVLDQTGTTSGQSNFYGGVVPSWTEEADEKDETDAKFRQQQLIAHKLVTYTEASDELLADSAIQLESLLTKVFRDVIMNELDYTYILGTGAGQPLGVVNAGATLRVARQTVNQINVDDVFNMLSQFMGQSPIWIAHQSTMPQILRLNGPAANPSYVWVSNLRDGPPITLMGYPVYFVENAATLGSEGDLILGDWSKYVCGDRQAVTIENDKSYRFKYDITAWRAVTRQGGRPWLSAPFTLRDGTTQVSPFVILDDAVVS